MKDRERIGTVVKIEPDRVVGILREEGTLTEWLFFMDELNVKVRPGDRLTFRRNDEYEQFVAKEVRKLQ